ncbi:hypothetical protein ASJ79_10675 [Mycobacterium sp. NAZ190054]|nr:hypothetical protein ASJ79_10675 [Mycobacterium sp. NAZ190054]
MYGHEAEWVHIGALDISVSPLTASQIASFVTSARGKHLLLNHNLHSAYLHQIDEEFRQLYRYADMVVIDGTPIRWLASCWSRKRFPAEYRVSSTDWIAALPDARASKRLFVFGATELSNARAVHSLQRQLRNWTVSGINGYVDERRAVDLISDFNPDLVIVGLGMPRQEEFLMGNLHVLPPATYATVGGAIDYVGGTTRLAPRWIGRTGLEWLWRLANEPRRLAYRYLIEPLLLVSCVAKRYLRLR